MRLQGVAVQAPTGGEHGQMPPNSDRDDLEELVDPGQVGGVAGVEPSGMVHQPVEAMPSNTTMARLRRTTSASSRTPTKPPSVERDTIV